MGPQSRPAFAGNDADLEAFMRLASSPIRSDDRALRLEEWDTYKMRRLVEEVERQGGRFAKGWLLAKAAHRVLDLRGAWLDGMCVGTVDLRGVRLDGASLRGAWLKGGRFTNATLRGVDLGPLEGPAIPGGFGWGASRLAFADFTDADLTGADLRGAWLEGAVFRNAALDDADLRGSDLSHASLVGTSLRGARLTGARVYGISAWDLKLCDNENLRRALVVSKASEPDILVDDLEVAQFVYLLLSREKLRNVISAVTNRGVLILGRFRDGGLEVLEGIADVLRREGYLPMIFDFNRPDDRDYSETVRILASLSRFVVADLSGGSVPHELASNVPFVEVPVVAVIASVEAEYSMFKDFFKYSWVSQDVVRFQDLGQLREAIPERVIAPAERIIAAKKQRLERDY